MNNMAKKDSLLSSSSSTTLLPTQSVIVESTTGNGNGGIYGEHPEMASESSSDGASTKLCLVCGQLSHGYHFGILACRACAAFFRRTVVEKKSYRCRQSGQCPIKKEMRNMCRACRFERCIALGMNKEDVQMNRDPIGKRNSKMSSGAGGSGGGFSHGGNSSSTPAVNNDLKAAISVDLARPKPQQLFGGAGTTPLQLAIGGPAGPTGSSVSITTSSTAPAPLLNPLAIAHTEQLMNAPIGINAASLAQIALPQPIRPLQNSISNYGTGETIALLPCPVPSSSSNSLLQRLLEGYRNFQSSQKSLYTVMYPDNIFAGETYRLVKHSEYVKMERGCISLMYSMLSDCFPPFESLSQELKVAALRVFSNRFTHLDQTYRTMTIFPGQDDPRFVLHYGQYADSTKLEYFFAEDHQDSVEVAKLCAKTLQRCRQVVNRMSELAIRDMEVAAMAAIILWNELAYMNVEDAKTRETIYGELHNNMVLTYGIASTGVRLGAIIDMIHDFNLIEKDIRESVIINKIFNPNFAEVWDDQ